MFSTYEPQLQILLISVSVDHLRGAGGKAGIALWSNLKSAYDRKLLV